MNHTTLPPRHPKLSLLKDTTDSVKDLYKSALLAREIAYSPYSGYKVGAAIRTSLDKIFSGCNIENASYGATNCAERVAIQKAISELGKIEIKEVLVLTDSAIPWTPCGLCRQVMCEFSQNATIYTSNLNGDLIIYSLEELLPYSFGANELSQSI
jgi:cytidine deaminase